jgi:hypothetical protein
VSFFRASHRFGRLASFTFLSVGTLLGSAIVSTNPADAAGVVNLHYFISGESQFTVPAGVTAITVTANGASGQTDYNGKPGGEGASETATIPVTPGTTLFVEVGVGGGTGFELGAGGGESDIRTCSTFALNCAALGTDNDPRLIVAGGGGAQGSVGVEGSGDAGFGSTTGCDDSPTSSAIGSSTFETTGASCTEGGVPYSGASGAAEFGGSGGTTLPGGGGGFYGGGSGSINSTNVDPASGGSSFVAADAVNVSGSLNSGVIPSVSISFSSTTPSAPNGVVATATTTGASVTWQAPDNGGDAILSYTVTSSPSGFTATVPGTETTTTVPGLILGQTYSFSVVAQNDVGTSPPSLQSNEVTPDPIPGTPVVTAAVGVKSATIRWTATDAGTDPILGYTVATSPGGSQSVAANVSSLVVKGLNSGASYTFSVTATNVMGTSAAGTSSTVTIPNIPGEVANLKAKAGAKSAKLTWSAPATNGSALTGYVVTIVGGKSVHVAASATGETITGLTAGKSYRFSVAAVNAVGSGPAAMSSSIKVLA